MRDDASRYRLETELKAYVAQGLYPLHMPGHKRRLAPAPDLPYAWDLTEVEGTDDLHRAEGILAEAMKRTAALYGAERTWYLVGGSTCGNLAAIRAAAPAGSEIICARNSHKSVFHAIELGGLQVHWLYPEEDDTFQISGSITPDSVRQTLQQYPHSKAVILTSPTYEGVVSDIRLIAQICHEAGVPLLVDEAHGAHLGLFTEQNPLIREMFPAGAVSCGADLVVQSPHKTLTGLTQTAWMHLQGSLLDAAELERQLDVFETSSPSYPLMASLDACTGLLRTDGRRLLQEWACRLQHFSDQVQNLQYFQILGCGRDVYKKPVQEQHPVMYALDRSKLLVNCSMTSFTGQRLAQTMRERFRFETEMTCGENLLAMTGIGDTEEDLGRFAETLQILDREQNTRQQSEKTDRDANRGTGAADADAIPVPQTRLSIAAALRAQSAMVSCASVQPGEASAEYIWAYPPGIPLLVPGEEISEAVLYRMQELEAQGTRLYHSHSADGQIRILTSRPKDIIREEKTEGGDGKM